VPVLPALADELRTHLEGRQTGFLFESNRHTRYSTRTVQSIVTRCARAAGIKKRVFPHLLRHSIATILLDSGLVPIDQVQKFLGHMHLSTTQFMRRRAHGLSGTTISGRWEESGSRRMRFDGLYLLYFAEILAFARLRPNPWRSPRSAETSKEEI
jgi:hypothetical protein